MSLIAILRPYVAAAQILVFVILLYRLFSTGLFSTYRLFTVYLSFEFLRICLFGFMDSSTKLYLEVYTYSQPITWILWLLVITELYELSLRSHVGLATWGRRVLNAALVLSALVSLGTLVLDVQQTSPVPARIATYLIIERVILLSLLLFLLILTWFLAYFPVPVNRNTILHVRIFTLYFLFKGTLMVVHLLVPSTSKAVPNLIGQLLAICCLAAWSTLLTKKGESVARVAAQHDPELEQRLVSQLNAINTTLLGSPKR